MKQFALCVAVLVALSSNAVQAQATVTEVDPFKFKATDLKGRVEETLRHKADARPVALLMRLYKAEPDKVLALLEPHAEDSDEEARYIVLDAAAQAHTSRALAMLGHLAADKNWSLEAAWQIYNRYTRRELLEMGGQNLKRALFRAAFLVRDTTYGYLLLASFKDTLELSAVRFLEERRQNLAKSTDERDTTSEIVALDLALAEIGESEAQQRISQFIARRETEKSLHLLRFLKYLRSKPILLQATELLNDKSKANEVHKTNGDLLARSRLCDEALVALAARAGLPNKFEMMYQGFLAPRFSDEELARSQRMLKTIFEAE